MELKGEGGGELKKGGVKTNKTRGVKKGELKSGVKEGREVGS